jgi:hypothetical protein
MASAVVTQSAYPTCGQVMNRARAYVNDSYRGGAGRILTNQASLSVECLNGAFEELSDKIGNNGGITLIKDNVILTPIPALPQPDPAVQIQITYNGFFNGVEMLSGPVLPSDCRAPLKLWERQFGSGLPFVPMTQPMEGLPSAFQGQWLRFWEYRQDAICLCGSTITEELRLRYETRFPVIAPDSPDDDWQNTEIDILSSVNALATIVAYNYARARGSPGAAIMQADAEKMMRYIVRRYTRRAQAIPYHRKPYETGGSSGGNGNWGTNLPF